MITSLHKSADTLSTAWALAFLDLMKPGADQRHPAVVTIEGIDPDKQPEDLRVRARLDQELKRAGESQSLTVANTLFPRSMWDPSRSDDSKRLYERYERAWPNIEKCRANRNGVYFRRLTAFHPENGSAEAVNQLNFIVETFKNGNHRRSALQAAILDPTRDHTNNRQKGFPCLQQVAFTPIGSDGLSVTGYYATQHQFEKAYGNYLGLYWLGSFMAKQLGLELRQVVCIASFLKLGNQNKSALLRLADDVRQLIGVS